MFYEIGRRVIHLNKHEEPTICWNNPMLCVQVNKNLTFIDFAYNLQSSDRKLDLNETSIKCPINNPATTQYLSGYVNKGIKNSELVEMATNPALWPHNTLLKSEMVNYRSFKCSPQNIIYQYQNIIAVLNNFGNVNFIASSRCGPTDILDFTLAIKKEILGTKSLSGIPNTLAKLKHTVYKLSTSAICWAPELNNDNSCYFVTAQKSGQLLFWLIKTHLKDIKETFCGSHLCNRARETVAILWIPFNSNRIILVCSNNVGQLIGCEFLIEYDKFISNREYCLWEYEDRMVAKHLHYFKYDDKYIIVFNKNRHVIVQLYDESFNMLSQNNLDIHDQKVTYITNSKNGFYICTLNAQLYKLDIVVLDDKVKLTLILEEFKENYMNYELYGMGFSRNNAILALAVKDQKLLHRKEVLKIEIIFLTFDDKLNSNFNIVLNNPSNKFTDIWDFIELLRYKIMRSKSIPDFDYNKLLLESDSNLYNLRVYYLILMMYTALKISKVVSCTLLPYTDIEEIQERILVRHASNMIKSIHEEYENNKHINNFKRECFIGAKKYVLYYCNKYKKNIKDYINQESLQICDSNVESICQYCDTILDGFTCKLGHLNMFCSMTFTPITSNDYLICKGCGVLAIVDIYNKNPTCLFCDINFVHYDMLL